MNFKTRLPKKIIFIAAGTAVAAITAFSIPLLKNNERKETENEHIQSYTYDTEAENVLASNVEKYLAQYVILDGENSSGIADTAVKSYNAVLSSGITAITEAHTAALEKNIRYALDNCLTEEQITENDFDALASGISGIILDTILSQIESSGADKTPEFEEQYLALTQSLQEQIDDLKEKSAAIHIRAKINDNPSASIDNNLSASQLEELKGETMDSVNGSLSEMKEEILSETSDNIDAMRKQIASEMDSRYGNIKDGKNGSDGRNGADGKNGENGKDGAAGKNGEDGKDGTAGADGKTAYFAYAEDEYGTGFSLTPTENSKYIGSCLSASRQQPTDPILYGDWSLYKGEDGKDGKDGAAGTNGKTTYIAYAEDEHGTGFSLIPTENSRYIGSCLSSSSSQPDDAGKYEWQEYRTYILSVTTDENNVTTLHIR